MNLDHLSDGDLELRAQEAAELRISDLWAYENDELDEEPDSAGPFCGCLTCEVREILDAAYPYLAELGRRMPGPSHADLTTQKEN